jgi:glycosyltransferase involved in cell wall biosynthesis
MSETKLSVVLATRNEETNIARCLESVKSLADEIIVVDEFSEDRTREIAKKMGAKVFKEEHHENFHITKQKAIDLATGDWILQLDADETVTPELAEEIKEVIVNPTQSKVSKLFARHQKAVETRDGKIGVKTGEIVAFFIPRRNIFLGEPLIHAGVYPDAVIRLFKKGKAYLPAKSVHEQMVIKGEVGWLTKDLLHYDSPTLSRYLVRANRYTDLTASDMSSREVSRNLPTLIYYTMFRPVGVFFNLFIRHKGFLDGIRGFLWSIFSALHFSLAYFKYYSKDYN